MAQYYAPLGRLTLGQDEATAYKDFGPPTFTVPEDVQEARRAFDAMSPAERAQFFGSLPSPILPARTDADQALAFIRAEERLRDTALTPEERARRMAELQAAGGGTFFSRNRGWFIGGGIAAVAAVVAVRMRG